MTIYEYWKIKGIDLNTLESIIDIFPTDSDESLAATELMQLLIDASFED